MKSNNNQIKTQSRRFVNAMFAGATVMLTASPFQTVEALPTHPGGFLTQSELASVRSNVASALDPWASAWDSLKPNGPDANYQPSVSAVMTNSYAMQSQGNAAWALTIKWVASGDINYAIAARRVIDGWVNTVTDMTACSTLRTGVGGSQMAQAAEILAHGFGGASSPTGSGWPAANIAAAKTWFKAVPYLQVSNGINSRSANWGTSALAGAMSMAIFCDDQAMFDYAVDAYKIGFTDTDDGWCGVVQYIDATGQNFESGRDQPHSQGGIGHLMEVALCAWNQGLNVIPFTNTTNTTDARGMPWGTTGADRVFIGHEYTAKYNLGFTVPYHPFGQLGWRINYGEGISASGRGGYSPIWEMATSLFTKAGYTPSFCQQVINSPGYAPEYTGGDHPGLGTLLYRTGAGTPRTVADSWSGYIVYNGGWGTWGTGVDYNGSEATSSAPGAYAEWTFNGTQIQWITRKASNMGYADVYLDGVLVAANVDTYSATEQAQFVAFSQSGLANASHTIRIVVKGTKNPASSNTIVNIDAFRLGPPTPTAPARPNGVTASTTDVAPYVQTNLSWTASAGATGYNIKRSTVTTGPYTTIASGVTGTSYIDNGSLTPGVPYFYVVTAVNGTGESVNSWESSTIPGWVDNLSPTITYAGMEYVYVNGSYKTSEHGRALGGQSATWTFTGTNVQWITRYRQNGGYADVYIDGVLSAQNIDTYAPDGSLCQRIAYSITGLSDTTHTIQVMVKGTRNPSSSDNHVAIDAFAVNCVPGYITAPFVRSVGGTATASSGTTYAPEVPSMAFDGNTNSKWYSGGIVAMPQWLQYQFAGGASQAVNQYQVTSANDVPQRDPMDWQFQASNDGSTWTTLDTKTGQLFANRRQMNTYLVNNTTAYAYYRLNITANNGGSGYGLQLSEFSLHSRSWASQDIGSVAYTGSTTYNPSGGIYTGAYVLNASGGDIWGTSDAFQYEYRPLTGNGTIIARIAAQSTNSPGKTGVMFRESLAANSKHVDLVIQRTAGVKMEYRTTTGGGSGSSGYSSGKAAAYWLKLVRAGNFFTGYMSPDGVTWTQVGQGTNVMNSTIYVGLAHGAVNNTVVATANVDNVTITTP